MTELTTEQKLKALADAGKTVAKKATEEEIDMLFLELEVEQEEKGKTEPVEPVEPVGDGGTIEADGGTVKVTGGYDEFLAAADPAMGDKDPTVIAWCKANLTRDEFEVKYEGRLS